MGAHSSPGTGDKRERILDAAEIVFARRGFFTARVSEIAKEAGVADGTIYLYFKSKDELLISLFEERMEGVVRELETAVAAEDDPREKLRAFIRTQLTLVQQNPVLAEVLTIELRRSSKFMKEHAHVQFGAFLKLLAGVVVAGQEAGVFRTTIPAPMAARAIFGALDELAVAWLLGRGEKFDIVRAADWIGSMILNGLESEAKS